MIETGTYGVPERREDFPMDVFLYVEQQLGEMRIRIMRLAEEHASNRQPEGDVFRVEPEDIDAVFPVHKKIEYS